MYSLDHEIQKGYILGVSSTHKLENFLWYHELGPLLGFTNLCHLKCVICM